MKQPRTILITGASSGVGEALALHYAQNGRTLLLHGRNAERLHAVAQACTKKGATTHTHIGDITDTKDMSQWVLTMHQDTPIDLAIANAGISAGAGDHGESANQIRDIFATNIDGVINTIHPLLSAMLARGKGQIAIMSSLAGTRGLPSCPAYSASKACVRTYGEALRGLVASKNVQVNVICPGYIVSRMTAINDFPMPMLMQADKAAAKIAKLLARNRARIAFPLPLYLPLWLLSCMSPSITDYFFSRLPAKPAMPDAKE